MYCENCGTKNDDNARFCCECGSPLMEAPQEEEKKTRGKTGNQIICRCENKENKYNAKK